MFINDHDLKPLYYQMEAENDVPFKWEYLMTLPKERKEKVMKLEEYKSCYTTSPVLLSGYVKGNLFWVDKLG